MGAGIYFTSFKKYKMSYTTYLIMYIILTCKIKF